eukprot:SAG31_NODE_118_length_24006_cov_8.219266_7_plen_366_part_00
MLMPNGLDDVFDFRIPAIIAFPPAHSPAVLAFAEARLTSGADSGQHRLAFRRSSNRGKNGTWGPMQYLYNDTQPLADGLNLGAAVYDAVSKTAHVLFNECNDEFGKPPCGPTGSLLVISSRDFGLSWEPPRNLTHHMVAAGYAALNPGPGSGIQLETGRLVVPAWGPTLAKSGSQCMCAGAEPHCPKSRMRPCWHAVALLSDDHGLSWHVSQPVPNPASSFRPNELMAAALPNGTLLLNARDETSGPRLLSWSGDGGSSWAPFKQNSQLASIICQGSTVALGSTLLFSHPFSDTARANGWIKFSVDSGESWWLWRQVEPGPFGYSAMSILSDDAPLVTIGLLNEGSVGNSTGIKWSTITDLLPRS